MAKCITVVTGGSTGIELAIVKQQVAAGAMDFNLYIQDFAEPVANATCLPCGVSQVAAVEATIAKCVEHQGQIDRLVCNSGLHLSETLEDTSEESLDRIIAINVKGAYTALKATLPVMR